MKKFLFSSVFICFEIFLLTLIVFLAIKIKKLHENDVKGIQYVTKIDKNNLIFDDSELKHFYEPKPNSDVIWNPDWLGYTVTNYINQDSLNEIRDYSVQKSKDTYRIITLGDSHTYGLYVEPSENYPSVLENLLSSKLHCNNYKQFEVINLGVPAYDVAYVVQRFIKRGLKYNPDITIWFITTGNFEKIYDYLIPLEKKYQVGNTVQYDPISHRSIAYTSAEDEVQRIYGQEYILDYQKKWLFKLKDYYKSNLLLVTNQRFPQIFKEVITQFTNFSPNFAYFDNGFDTNSDEKYHLADRHPNKEGYKKIAEDIFEYLKNNYFKDCSSK